MENNHVADCLRELVAREQALKGMTITFWNLSDRYCQLIEHSEVDIASAMQVPRAMQRIVDYGHALRDITKATSGISSLQANLQLSVSAYCTAALGQVVRAIAGPELRADLDAIISPLNHIVGTKVWSIDERRKLFELCFKILGAFKSEFQHLINEVCQNFPEETEGIPGAPSTKEPVLKQVA